MEMAVSNLIQKQFDALVDAVESFNHWWTDHALDSEAYVLHTVSNEDQPDRASSSASIDVERLQGRRAVEPIANMIKQFERVEGQVPGTVLRLPSLVVVDGLDRRRLHRLNVRKDALREAIAAAVPAGIQRDRFCRRLFPGVSMLQVYRHLPFSDEISHPQRVAFTWSPVTVSTKVLDAGEVLTLFDEREKVARMEQQEAVLDAIAIARRLVATLPKSHSIVRRKPVAPHPRVTVFGTSRVKHMLHANLPLFLPAACRDIPVTELTSFDPNCRRKIRSDRKKVWPILESLNLYSLERV